MKIFSILFCVCTIFLYFSKNHDIHHDIKPENLQIIMDYINWRGLDHVVIFDNLQKEGVSRYGRELFLYISSNIFCSCYSGNEEQKLQKFLSTPIHEICIIVTIKDGDLPNILIQASVNNMFKEHYSWLLIVNSAFVDEVIDGIRKLRLDLRSDVVMLTFSTDMLYNLNEELFAYNNSYKNFYTKKKLKWKEGNFHVRDIIKENADFSSCCLLKQLYKIRMNDTRSLIVTDLGVWDMREKFRNVSSFILVHRRNNLNGFPLIVGMKNGSYPVKKIRNSIYYRIVLDDEDDDDVEEIVVLIGETLNASLKVSIYDEVGHQQRNGQWTGIIGGLIADKIDMSVDKIPITLDKITDISFTYPILSACRNLYLHPTEYTKIRNIYLAPFSFRLLICVFCTAIILTISMSVITIYNNRQHGHHSELSDSWIWIIGILSMQGSTWTPTSTSGNIALIFALVFALIMYNSYAAWITSILSVYNSDINNLDDIFNHDYGVGFIQDSEDEQYLQKQNNELQKIYISGLDTKIQNIEAGLLLAANSKFAIFSSEEIGRRALKHLIPSSLRCQVQEFVLKETKEYIAFPLRKESPYLKIISLSILRLKQSGALSKMREMMVPHLPNCQFSSLFMSAGLDDVAAAFEIFTIGLSLSVIVLIIELSCFYYGKRSKKKKSQIVIQPKGYYLNQNLNIWKGPKSNIPFQK